MILHYGMPYFEAAVKAMAPQVDKIVILYVNHPSQGHVTDMPNPDSRDDLKNIADKYKCAWVDGNWMTEGEHCEAIRAYTQGYDWLIRFDSDEIFPEGAVDYYIKEAEKSDFKQYRMPFFHFWRSFEWVCRDGQFPFRLERLNGGVGEDWLHLDGDKYRIYHMGYAMPDEYIEYKMQVQGHRNEWRPDWYKNIWKKNDRTNCHPVSYVVPLWTAEKFDKTKMPQVLKDHPYFDKELI